MAHGEKSDAVRKVIAANPTLKAKEIAAKVKAEYGLDVAVGNIYQVMNNGSKKAATVREPGIEELQAFKVAADKVGGVDEVEKVLQNASDILNVAGDDLDLALKMCKMLKTYAALFASKPNEPAETNEAEAA
jgi:translation elongation factor EF-1beta